IYAAVDSCETAQEIWLRVQQMMKGSDIGIQEKKAKLFNEWERFTSNEGESIKSYYHRFLKLMNDLKRNKHFSEKIASNLKFLNNLQPEWSRYVTIVHQTKDLHTADYTQLYDFLKYNQKKVDELKAERLAKIQDHLALMENSNNPFASPALHQDQSPFNQNFLQQPITNPEDITDPKTAMNMALTLMAKAFKLNYSTPTNNNQRISLNPRNRQIAQSSMNMGQDRQMQMIEGKCENQFRQYARQNAGNLNGEWNSEQDWEWKSCGCTPRRRDAAYLQTQLLIAQKEEAGIQLQAEEYDLMAAAADLDEIEEVNANCILMANLQQASTSGTQTDSALVYNSDGSAEVHENYDNNEIFNMFTQEEQYTELLEPIPESHQVPLNDNEVISEVTDVEQDWKTVEQHSVNFEETRALYESLYQNLAVEVKKVNSVNRKLKETNADLTTELARRRRPSCSMNGKDELKAKRLAKIQDPLALMANSNNPYASPAPHQDLSPFNQNYMQQPMTNPEDITDLTTAMNMALSLMAKSFKINYSTPTNNNQRISSNPKNRQIAQPGMNMGQDRQMQMVGGNGGNQFRQYAWQNAGNLNGYNAVQNVGNQVAQNPRVQNDGIQNQIGNGNLVAVRAEGNAAGHNRNQLRCYNCRGVRHLARDCTVRPRRKEEAGIQLQAEEYDLMAAATNLDEIEEVNANCILKANLQQASSSSTQTNSTPVYDSDGSAEVHEYENCYNNEIFNMFTQEEQYTELLEPIPEPQQVPQNDNNVISEVTNVEQGGKTVEQHSANFKETRALYESLYHNLAVEVKKVNSVNRKLKETNTDLTTELA
nr:hypothetical protein [Tanacetum cinerariifolium]